MSALKKLTKPQAIILQKLWAGQFIMLSMGEHGRQYQLSGGGLVSKTTFDALSRLGVLIPGNDGFDVSTVQTYRAKAMVDC